MAASDTEGAPRSNLRWAHRGGSLDELLEAVPETVALAPPADDEVIARVEAVSICSSDIKVVRMGNDHPLLAQASGGGDTVLGHEMSLRIEEVGAAQAGRYRPGQRLALQPAMRIDGRRRIIGFDVPGGFAQYLRLGPDALAGYVFEVPESLSAAEIALLEPYGCVERAYRPNARQAFDLYGSVLIVLAEGAERYFASRPMRWRRTVVVAPAGHALPPSLGAEDVRYASLAEVTGERFDDIVALGEVGAGDLARLPPLLSEDGMLLQARQTSAEAVPLDAARVHYDRLAFVGTTEADILDALTPRRQRFDAREGGVALVHGAGGAMGRIHVHRLLRMEGGPATVIATSRKGARLADLEADFGAMAAERNCRLVVADMDHAAAAVSEAAPRGIDEAVVVVPDSAAVAAAAKWLATDGLLSVFSGFPYGGPVQFPLTDVAVYGKRITGSTGCLTADMKDVLVRVLSGDLDLLANLKAVGGLKALPKALDAVNKGEVSGKVVIYPQVPDMPFRRLQTGWTASEERRLTGQSVPRQGS